MSNGKLLYNPVILLDIRFFVNGAEIFAMHKLP